MSFELCIEPAARRASETTIYASIYKGEWYHLQKVLSWISSGLLIERVAGWQWSGQRTPRLSPHQQFGSSSRHVRQPRAQLAARIPESVSIAVAGVVISRGIRACSRRGRYSRAIYTTRQAVSPGYKSSWAANRFQGQDDRSKGQLRELGPTSD